MGYPRLRLVAPVRLLSLAALVLSLFITARPASAAYATLAWTSPGDNGGSARVYYYDLRISANAITGTDTLSWWNAATKIPMTGKTPLAPGSPESILLNGLVNGAKYYAILRSADSQLNWSRYSNVATFIAVTAITGVDPPGAPELVLGAPRPSPTSGRADVILDLPKSMNVEASVFDAQGRLVRTLDHAVLAGGPHILHWDGMLDRGGNAVSGVYWIRVAAAGLVKRQKVVVVR
jgi:hypothetical protein